MTKKYLSSDDLLKIEQQTTESRRQRLRQTAEGRQRGLMVLMEDVYNPHNLAAIARSCDAFGVQEISFTLENHDLFDPAQLGMVSSRSASKWLDYRIFEDGTEDCLKTLKSEGWHILATLAEEDTPSLYDVDLAQYEKLVVMVGNEHAGLSPKAAALADSGVYIPMRGLIRSFNVSVATALILAEITRQRAASPANFSISPEEADALYADFLLRSHHPAPPD